MLHGGGAHYGITHANPLRASTWDKSGLKVIKMTQRNLLKVETLP
jgi:hypothetical protein